MCLWEKYKKWSVIPTSDEFSVQPFNPLPRVPHTTCLTLSHLTLHHFTPPHPTLHHFTLSHPTPPYPTSSHPIHLTPSHPTPPYPTSPHPIPSHLTLSHPTLPHPTSPYTTPPHLTPSHPTSPPHHLTPTSSTIINNLTSSGSMGMMVHSAKMNGCTYFM